MTLAPDPRTELSAAEAELIEHLRRQTDGQPAGPGWAHSSVAALLLAHGRLFAPAPWPGGDLPGDPGRCYVESVSWAWASSGELAYVEGLAWHVGCPVEHAWCAGADGRAQDPTWRRPGAAYLGLPVVADHAAAVMGERAGPLLLSVEGPASDLARGWMHEGIPDGLLVDVGRPVPS